METVALSAAKERIVLAAVMARSIACCTQKLETALCQALNLRDKEWA